MPAAKKSPIRRRVTALWKRIHDAHKEIDKLQSECSHPGATKKHCGDTGNYDPSCDRYWTEFKCPNCDKQWEVDGSV